MIFKDFSYFFYREILVNNENVDKLKLDISAENITHLNEVQSANIESSISTRLRSTRQRRLEET